MKPPLEQVHPPTLMVSCMEPVYVEPVRTSWTVSWNAPGMPSIKRQSMNYKWLFLIWNVLKWKVQLKYSPLLDDWELVRLLHRGLFPISNMQPNLYRNTKKGDLRLGDIPIKSSIFKMTISLFIIRSLIYIKVERSYLLWACDLPFLQYPTSHFHLSICLLLFLDY